MIDVHCHVIDSLKTMNNIHRIKTKLLFLMTTKKQEWQHITGIANHVKCFGIHPWFAHLHCQNDIDELEIYLNKFKGSLVGEIGLDKIAVDPETKTVYPMDQQLEIFKKQMDIAAKLKRPVSIHCVHAHGIMLQYFQSLDKHVKTTMKQDTRIDACPPSIMMHSYTGSPEIGKQLMKLPNIGPRFYFSFSDIVNSRSAKSSEKIKAIPDDRILLESDVHACEQVDGAMEKSLQLVSGSKGWSLEFTISKTTENAQRFLTQALSQEINFDVPE